MTKSKTEYPASAVDLRSAIEAFAEGERRALAVCFPACVRSYDRKTHIATVVPLVKQGILEKEWVYKVREAYEVSVRAIQIGGFTIDIPLYVGDTGWVIASDRDTALLKQEGSLSYSVLEKDRSLKVVDSCYPQKPHQTILHDYSRGFFIPDNWGQWDAERIRGGEAINLGDALYIGSSVGTKDSDKVATKDDDEDGTPNAGGDQNGDGYDKKTSSAVAIERDGGVHVLSNTPKQDDVVSRLSVVGDTVECVIDDEKNKSVTESIISPCDGVLKRYESPDKHFLLDANGGMASLKSISSDSTIVNMFLSEGVVTIEATKRIEIEAEDNIQVVNSDYVQMDIIAKNVTMTSKDELSVNADKIDIKSDKDVSITSSSDITVSSSNSQIDFGAIGNVTMKCSKTMHFKACYEIKQSVHEGGSISINSKDPISISEGFNTISIGKISVIKGAIGVNSPYVTEYVAGTGGSEPSQKTVTGNVSITAKSISISAKEEFTFGAPETKLEGYNKGTVKDYKGMTVYIWIP